MITKKKEVKEVSSSEFEELIEIIEEREEEDSSSSVFVSPLWRTLTGRNYYDLFTVWGGHIPAPLTLFRFLPLWIRGKNRNNSFFQCPSCGAKSFYAGYCQQCCEDSDGLSSQKNLKVKNLKKFFTFYIGTYNCAE